jgi:hypothetical protein
VAIVTEKTKARKIAETVDREGRFGSDNTEKDREAFERFGDKAGPFLYGAANAVKTVAKMPKALMARPRRSEEDMNELARETAKGMKKGGMVSASKRADGCAQRGKTKGRMV